LLAGTILWSFGMESFHPGGYETRRVKADDLNTLPDRDRRSLPSSRNDLMMPRP
jgi:hypothetical protein